MLISASLSLGRRNAGPASALMSGDRDKLHERQRQGDTQDCPLRVTGAAAEETLQEGYSCRGQNLSSLLNYRNGFRHPWLSDAARRPHGVHWTGEDGGGHARPRRKAAIRVSPLGVSGNCVGYALHNILDLLGKYCLSLSQRVRAQQFASCLLDSVGFLTRHVIASMLCCA